MIYLLDANVLIDADRDYYPLERVPEFWEWLLYHGTSNAIKLPIEIWEEITQGNGDLVDWLKQESVKDALLLDGEIDPDHVDHVVTNGYAPDLTDDELEKLGRDPFLIAHAYADRDSRCVVTTEVSKPTAQRANKHVPDVCGSLIIPSCHTFELTRRLNFSTSWRSRS
ncbi:MAG TPA: DUF4411 family protein [Gemmatimonadaceae bacterium]|nr:DUF4411 family protein [Gemmatimonadaceae bacterium]